MKTSENIDQITGALIKFQCSLDPIRAEKKNTYFKSSYADLAGIWNAIRPSLLEHSLAVVQDAVTLSDGVSVYTRILHSSGQWMEFGPLMIPMGKKDAHSTGSAISYAKRYGLAAALGLVAEEDDDGNRAVDSIKKSTKKITSEEDDDGNKSADSVKRSSKKITSEQVKELEEILKGHGTVKNNFMEWAKIESLSDIEAHQYDYYKRTLIVKVGNGKS